VFATTFGVVSIATHVAESVPEQLLGNAMGAIDVLSAAAVSGLGGAFIGQTAPGIAAEDVKIHFASVSSAAIFHDSLGRFINECAAVCPMVTVPAMPTVQGRAAKVTVSVIVLDLAIGTYLASKYRKGRSRLSAEGERFQQAEYGPL
jgi:hypothetical protein